MPIFSQASAQGAGSGVWKAARSCSSRSPIVPSWPRKQSAIRRRQHSNRWAFNASKLSNTGMGTRKFRRA